ncbi:hypothetical protein FOL47_007773 [Perkinsus chesapeaki]|uniref:Exportin-T n=1 Tax=Perkinsus chesapeaki TaxID=330153 RepID=A0A7J6LIS7_PERCH|nr:hypothetical protein FOL47_007773 [Perkinsus chesapeaki]
MSVGAPDPVLVQAVEVLFNYRSDPSDRQKAEQYCNETKQRSDAWEILSRCAFAPSGVSMEAQFWSLQALSQLAPGLNLAQRQGVRQALCHYVTSVLAPGTEVPVAIVNRIAVLYMQLMCDDYQSGVWSSAIKDLLQLSSTSDRGLDFMLRVLISLDQELIGDDVRNMHGSGENSLPMRVKDTMRESGDINRIVEVLFNSLTAGKSTELSLNVLSRYVAWAEITLFANAHFIELVTKIVESNTCTLEQCQHVCTFIAAMCHKKMSPAKRLTMVLELDLLGHMERMTKACQADSRKLAKVSEMYDKVSESVMESQMLIRNTISAADTSVMAAWRCVQNLVVALLEQFYANGSFEIAASVDNSLQIFLGNVRKMISSSGEEEGKGLKEEVKPVVTEVMRLSLIHLCYPQWFNHESPAATAVAAAMVSRTNSRCPSSPASSTGEAACLSDESTSGQQKPLIAFRHNVSGDDVEDGTEQEVAFSEFRSDVCKLIRKALAVDKDTALDFVRNTVASITQGNQAAALADNQLEACLTMLHVCGEQKAYENELGPTATQILHCPAIMQHRSWLVQLQTLELICKYSGAASRCIDPVCLPALVGGVRSKNPKVAKRASFLLVKFCKQHKAAVAPEVGPFVNELSSSLAITPGQADRDYQDNLYEAVGTLLSQDLDEQVMTLLAVLGQFSTVLDRGGGDLVAVPPGGTTADCLYNRVMLALASLAKAIEKCSVGLEAWDMVLGKLRANFAHVAVDRVIRQSMILLCRQLLQTLPSERLAPVLSDVLPVVKANSTSQSSDMVEFLGFVAHLITQSDAELGRGLVTSQVPGLVSDLAPAWQSMPVDSPETRREKLELGVAILGLLRDSATKQTEAFVEVLRSTPAVLALIKLCIGTPGEVQLYTASVQIVSRLVEATTRATDPEFIRVMLADLLNLPELLPICVASMRQLNVNDYESVKAVFLVSQMFRNVALTQKALPPESQSRIQSVLQSTLGGGLAESPELARFYDGVINGSLPPTQLRETLLQCVKITIAKLNGA